MGFENDKHLSNSRSFCVLLGFSTVVFTIHQTWWHLMFSLVGLKQILNIVFHFILKVCRLQLSTFRVITLIMHKLGYLLMLCSCKYAWNPVCLLPSIASASARDHCCADTLHSGTATPKPRSHKAWLSASKHPSIHRHSTLPEPSDLSQRSRVSGST